MLFPCRYYSDDYFFDNYTDNVEEDDIGGKYYHLSISVQYTMRGKKEVDRTSLNEMIRKSIDKIYTINQTIIRSGGISLVINPCKLDVDKIKNNKLTINLLCFCNYTGELRSAVKNFILSVLNRNIDRYLYFRDKIVSIDDRNKIYIGQYTVSDFC
jgi:hypothetical protein